jgi:hopene-associated glycosyltransferase HpnB
MIVLAVLTLGLWLYLVFARGGFWLGRERDRGASPAPLTWPAVAVVVPARNEAECVGQSIPSLLAQDFRGPLRVILVDDNSDDATAVVARGAAARAGAAERLTVLTGQPLPAGWTGKLWALAQGIDHVIDHVAQGEGQRQDRPTYLLLTDADIVHAPDTVAWLVAHAQANKLVLTSLMAKLRCESLAERMLVPAFIFFFEMLYPFAWVNRPQSPTAAAAGGCVLLRLDAFEQAGGIAAIRSAVIDDCALAALMKPRGPIWLGLTERARSIRAYPGFEDIRRMVARSAYAQLQYSPLLLAATVAGLVVTYLVPPLLAVFAGGWPQVAGILAWLLMALAFQPTLRFYRVSPLWGPALPAIAAIYLLFTLDSAVQHARGRGASWKGRFQAKAVNKTANETANEP